VQLVSKISNLCDHKSRTLQTDGQTDRQTDDMRSQDRKCTKVHCAVKMQFPVNDITMFEQFDVGLQSDIC